MGVWLRLPGLENPVSIQEEVDRARPRFCAQVLVVNINWYNIGEAGSGGGVKITEECQAILVESSTYCLGTRRARWCDNFLEIVLFPT